MKEITRGDSFRITITKAVTLPMENVEISLITAAGRRYPLPWTQEGNIIETPPVDSENFPCTTYGVEVKFNSNSQPRRTFRRKILRIVEADNDMHESETLRVEISNIHIFLADYAPMPQGDAPQQQADWNELDPDSPAFIKGKPFGKTTAEPDSLVGITHLGYTPEGLDNHGEGTRVDADKYCYGVFAWPNDLGVFDPDKTYRFQPIVNMEIEDICSLDENGELDIYDWDLLALYILTGQRTWPEWPDETEYGFDPETGEWETEEQMWEYEAAGHIIDEELYLPIAEIIGTPYPIWAEYETDPETGDKVGDFYIAEENFGTAWSDYVETLYTQYEDNGGWLPQISEYEQKECQPIPFSGYSGGIYYPSSYIIYSAPHIDLLYVPTANCIVAVANKELQICRLAYHPELSIQQLPDEFVPSLLWHGFAEARDKSLIALQRANEASRIHQFGISGRGIASNPYKLILRSSNFSQEYNVEIPLTEMVSKMLSPDGNRILPSYSDYLNLQEKYIKLNKYTYSLFKTMPLALQSRIFSFTYEEWAGINSGPTNYRTFWCPNPVYGFDIPLENIRYATAMAGTSVENLSFSPIPDRPVNELSTSGGPFEMDLSDDGKFIRIKPNGSDIFAEGKSLFLEITGLQPIGAEFIEGLLRRINTLEEQIRSQ